MKSSYGETETQSEAADRRADSWVFHILCSQRRAQRPEKKVGAAPANNESTTDNPGPMGSPSWRHQTVQTEAALAEMKTFRHYAPPVFTIRLRKQWTS